MKRHLSVYASLLMLSASSALADVPADQAARLGKDLTPMGAEMGGTGDVPAWTGGMTAPPSGIKFDPKTQHPPNPFPGDKPRFTITAANMAQYADRLDEGQKAMLTRYADFKIPVYESRRTCTTPQFVFAATRNNAKVGKLTADGEGVTGGIMGAPFPLANNAMELIWNEKLRYLTNKATRTYTAAPVQTNGSYNLIKIQDEVIYRWGDPAKKSAEELDNISLKYISNTIGPARLAGNVILVHESLNATVEPRKAWSYSPGTRRTRRAPDIAYDNPGFNTDAMTTADSFGGFNGAMDRYNWTVKGRSVKFIPYNAYEITNAKYADLLKPKHLNQDLARYEPHRVWTVEATLKPGQRHVYSRRVFQLDEDTYTPTGVEIYDGRGQLWRYQELHLENFYQVPACFATVGAVYDLTDGRYLAGGMIAEEQPINFFADELTDDRYTPEALRTLGVR
jgi:hypothetical protein